jgi:hypothetical protein
MDCLRFFVLSALKMLRISLFGPPDRCRTAGSQQPEHYAQFFLKLFWRKAICKILSNYSGGICAAEKNTAFAKR